MKKTYKELVKNLRKEIKNRGFQKVALGLSGGLDSAVTLKLAVDAIGAEYVAALIMPEIGLSNPENIEHAKILAEHLKVKTYYQPINSFLVSFHFTPWGSTPINQMNLRSRLRMVLLYSYANTQNALVLGTSNKSELLLGYGTKYGDLAADIEVIGKLYKTEVKELARAIGLPSELIEKKPTAELAPDQTDESDLGAPYEILDKILKLYEENRDEKEITDRGFESSLVKKTLQRIALNKHKSELPHIIEAEVEKFNEVNIPMENLKSEDDQRPLF